MFFNQITIDKLICGLLAFIVAVLEMGLFDRHASPALGISLAGGNYLLFRFLYHVVKYNVQKKISKK
ncbi:MAG: hypothetical protein ACYCQI_14720 [Gammaproteobacteria bacterium]